MKKTIKIILIISIISVSLAMICFLLGATACFQKNIDLIETVMLILVWLPAFAFVILSVSMLKKGWLPITRVAKISVIILITVTSLFFVITLVRNTNLYGWIKEKVDEDYVQITADEKYEYRLELINLFQRNSYARIHMKNIETGEQIKIPLDIPTEEIIVLSSGSDNSTAWSKLMPTENESIYVFTTTEFFDSENTYCFQIDIKAKSAKAISQPKELENDI